VLRVRAEGYFDVAGVNLFDSEGILINSSETWPVPDIKISDRPYFKAFKSGSAATPVLIELVQSRFSAGWATVIAHKVIGPKGEFLGVVTRAITPASFEKFFASLALGEGAAISMYHRDGTLLARYPHVEAMIGRNFSSGQLHQQILSRLDHGTMRLTSPLDGLDRLASIRALADFPISIIATTTVGAALADWREQTRYLVAVAGLSVLVITVMLFLVVRKLSQQHQLEKQRLDTAVNNIPQGLVVYDRLARVTVCNRRYIEMFGLSPDVAKARLHHAGSDLASERDRIF
jgi:PAS domain-containing protein